MHRTTPALALAASLLLILTGCVGGDTAAESAAPDENGGDTSTSQDAAGDDGQSVDDACAIIAETITEATAQFEGSAADDLSSVAAAMEAAAGELSAMSAEITNDEVAALLPRLQQMFDEAGEMLGTVDGGDASDLENLEELGTRFQQTGADFAELCAP